MNGNFICSTEEHPYYKSLSADPVEEPVKKPPMNLTRDLKRKLDTPVDPKSSEPMDLAAFVGCSVIPSYAPGGITGAPKTEEIKADTEALKQTADEKSFHIDDKKK